MNSLTAMLYSELDLICVIILVIVVYKLVRAAAGLQDRLLAATMCGIILFFAADWLWGLTEYGVIPGSIASKYALNIAYYITGAAVSFLWFLYCEEMLKTGLCHSKRRLAFAAAPLVLYVVLAASSPVSRFFFYIDGTASYERGPGYTAHLLIAYAYMAVATIKMLSMAAKRENYANRHRYLTLAGFALPPLLAGVLQIFVELLPLQGPGMTLAVFLVFINLQELQISRDQLTGINNRANMITYMENRMRHRDRTDEGTLHLLMIDVDRFKRINDKYGHTEGDAALVRVAGALKTGSDDDCFVARYGGDEFAMLCENRTDAELETLCSQLRQALDAANTAAATPYQLAISVGCATYRGQYRSIPEFIAAADRELYLEKERHHRAEVPA